MVMESGPSPPSPRALRWLPSILNLLLLSELVYHPFAILSAPVYLRDIPGPTCETEQSGSPPAVRCPTEADSPGRERVSRPAPGGRQGHTLRLVSMHRPVTANPNQAPRHSNGERHTAPQTR